MSRTEPCSLRDLGCPHPQSVAATARTRRDGTRNERSMCEYHDRLRNRFRPAANAEGIPPTAFLRACVRKGLAESRP